MTSHPILRFAPSPNGYMHPGHAFSALATYDLANRLNGRFLLRIEDIDTGRTREEFIEGIFEDLSWLGLKWEQPVRRQSEHFSDYEDALDRLRERGLLYPCFATRKEIAQAIAAKNSPVYPLDPDGTPLYPQLHKYLAKRDIDERIRNGEPYALRINMDVALESIARDLPLAIKCMDKNGQIYQREAEPQKWGDTVIKRKDTPTSYHLSVVLDDALQSVTHVTRGKDLEAATDLHRLLQHLLGLPSPIYFHHDLILDSDGHKLSKSIGSKSISDYRDQGYSVEDLLREFDLPLPSTP